MTSRTPFVSVVVPAYNDSDGIALTLESITNQTYPTDRYEIIVCDNGSTDRTREVIRSYVERHPELVTLVVEDEIQNPAAARNRGIEATSGSVLAFIDADMTVDETWLQSVTESLLDGDHDYMGCEVETYAPDGRETVATISDSLFLFRIREYMEESNFTGAGCLAVRREVFDTVGGFDTHLDFGADIEFGNRVHDAGFDQHFEPSITMYHPARSSISEQVEKSFRVGRRIRQLHEYRPDRFDAYSPLRLRSYLPRHPQRFYSRIGNGDRLSMREIIGLYLLDCLKKYARTGGSLYEYFGGISTARK